MPQRTLEKIRWGGDGSLYYQLQSTLSSVRLNYRSNKKSPHSYFIRVPISAYSGNIRDYHPLIFASGLISQTFLERPALSTVSTTSEIFL